MTAPSVAETGSLDRAGINGAQARCSTVNGQKPCILFLHPGPGPLHTEPRLNMFHHLGARVGGAAIFASWARDRAECEAWRSRTLPACGGFDYRPVPTYHVRWEWLRPFRTLAVMYREALRASAALPAPVDVVVGYSPYGVGFVAWLVAKTLGVPLVIQVQNDMRFAYLGHHGPLVAIKKRASRLISRFVLSRAKGWHVYFPEQTGEVQLRSDQERFQFTDFTPVSSVPTSPDEQREFLLVGYPWEVKGVDLAIRAFRQAGESLGGWTLRVIGHCPNREPYERLAGGDPRIVFEGATLHLTVLDRIARCGVYLLPSRTEAYGRVAIEAMAAGRPIIGSRVGGIPTYVEDGVCGLLVPPEDVSALRDAMVRLAQDQELRSNLGRRGREIALDRHREERWVARFENMIRSVRTCAT